MLVRRRENELSEFTSSGTGGRPPSTTGISGSRWDEKQNDSDPQRAGLEGQLTVQVSRVWGPVEVEQGETKMRREQGRQEVEMVRSAKERKGAEDAVSAY
jgi:hypothetical protein